MKLAVAALLIGSAAAFTPVSQPTFRLNSLAMGVVTGPKGSAAKSAEEDLELTRQVIMEHIDDEAPEPKKAESEPPKEDDEE